LLYLPNEGYLAEAKRACNRTIEGKLLEGSVLKAFKVTMGLDLQPDGLTAGLAEHCQPNKKYR